ncbi:MULTISPECIES: hypothetical protein [Haloarcula]|uniref:hypothetical protein n=1 Tax=Haloarcula TaxID=2237 RepID=UPI0023E7769E|nr:hypothetical protein [Halomicroarcula sp. SHR3]
MQDRLSRFDGTEREYWDTISKEHGIVTVLNEMCQRLSESNHNGTFSMGGKGIKQVVVGNGDFLNEFPTMDVLALGIYTCSSYRTWQVVEAIGGIDEDNFYCMFNENFTKRDGIPMREFA